MPGRRLTRALVALLALALGATAAVLPARPAEAGDPPRAGILTTGDVVCFEIIRNGKIIVRCLRLPVLVRPELPPAPCAVCLGLGFDFPERLPYDHQLATMDALGAGFGLLTEAELATDPEQVAGYRAAAMDRFTAAAVAATDPDIDPAAPQPATGELDLATGEFTRSEVPSLQAAGAAIVAGFELLASADPDRVGAGKLFDRAYQQLAGGRTG
jgi:hypothetical protein